MSILVPGRASRRCQRIALSNAWVAFQSFLPQIAWSALARLTRLNLAPKSCA
jgi:hypothetical protein